MEYFVVKEKLPSLNDVIGKNRCNKYAGAKYKKDIEEKISYYIANAVAKGMLHKQENPCWIVIEWIEKTKRRDSDNIQSSQKFLLDALVKCGILQNDSRKYVKNVAHIISDGKEDMVKVMFASNVEFIIT